MDLVTEGKGVSIAAGNGGGDARDTKKITIAMDTHIDTPRPNQIFSNQELIDLQCKEIGYIYYYNFTPLLSSSD